MSDIREIIGNTTATPTPQADWNQTNTAKPDYIKNKPEVPTEAKVIELIYQYGGDVGSAAPPVQADWAQTDKTKADYIKNKITKVSQLQNDIGYVTNQVLGRELDDFYLAVGRTYETKNDASDNLAEAKSYARDKIDDHNASTTSHADIRNKVKAVSDAVTKIESDINGKLDDMIVTTGGTGAAYTATVAGITELKAGVSFVMIPHVTNTINAPTLSVNNQPAIVMYRCLSTVANSYTSVTSTTFIVGKPYRVMYDGKFWILSDYTRTVASDISGRILVANGGVPVTNAANAGKVLTTNDDGTPEWQTPTGGGDTSNLATVDKIAEIYTDEGAITNLIADYNIVWDQTFGFYDEDGEPIGSGKIYQTVPIVAGDNVTFTVDEENQVVKINSSASMVGAWVLNETLPLVENRTKLDLNFECDGVTYSSIDLQRLVVDDTLALLLMDYEPSDNKFLPYLNGWEHPKYRYIKILEEPSDDVATWINANAKRATPAIGVDKIAQIDTWYTGRTAISNNGDGISWDDEFAFIDEEGYEIKIGEISQKIPIVAGDNVTFTVDEENNAIAINATGGEIDTSNLVKKYAVELSGGETVSDIINKLVTTYPDYVLGEWSLVAFTGATTALYGLTINHYGGNIYNIGGMDFGTYYTMANNVTDWSQVSVWAFSGCFQPPVPYCDESNNDQFLRVANGAPTWATVPNAEDNTF